MTPSEDVSPDVLAESLDSMLMMSYSNAGNEETSTITGCRSPTKFTNITPPDEIRLLAASAQITEASYSVSDIHTRIFEIQELRHQDLGSNSINGSSTSTSLSTVIDQALIGLDERLESVAQNISLISTALEPIHSDPDLVERLESDDVAVILVRKHNTLLSEWESVQREAEILRDELKEDKWLLVFRNASDQADGMMNSLEKVLDQCQIFMDSIVETGRSSWRPDHGPPLAVLSNDKVTFVELRKALQAKEKYYVPSVSKVLSVLDKGVRIRATKNGECLRRHADMRVRWKDLRGKIFAVDTAMDATARTFEQEGVSDDESAISRATTLDTPAPSNASSATSALARSVSPFRKFAAKMTRSNDAGKDEAITIRPRLSGPQREPSTSTIRIKPNFASGDSASIHIRESELKTPIKSNKPRWNYSTQPSTNSSSIQQVTPPPRRPSSSLSRSAPGPRSASRISMSRSTSSQVPVPARPPSRQAMPRSESRSALSRPRPSSPTHIPAPNFSRALSGVSHGSAFDDDDEVTPTSLMQRAMTPSSSFGSTPQSTSKAVRRQSQLPLPNGGLRAPSPMNARSISPGFTAVSGFTGYDGEATTPTRPPRSAARPKPSGVPSSYSQVGGFSSRPPSQSGSRANPNRVGGTQGREYVVGNLKDPLDVQVASIVNSVPHGFIVERVDAHWKRPPPSGDEIKAQYAFSNALGRKVVACKLLVIQRAAPKTLVGHVETKKVMCRIGGGWQDLESFLQNHGC